MLFKAFLGHCESLGDAFLTTFSCPFLLEEGLLEIEGRSKAVREVHYLQTEQALTVGRKGQVEIRILDRNVSGRHAQILAPVAAGQPWRIVDLDSSNGTFVNGDQLNPHEPRPLTNEAVVSFGPVTSFVFLEPQTFLFVLRQYLAKQAPKPEPAQTAENLRPEQTMVGRGAVDPRDGPSGAQVGKPDAGLFLFCEPFDPIPLEPGQTLIVGRSAAHADVVLPHPNVSRRHAEIECREEGVYLRDLHSANGVFMSGTRLSTNELQIPIGKEFQIADFRLVFKGSLPEQKSETFVLKPKTRRRLIRGDLAKAPLGELLVALEEKNKSGLLEVTSGDITGMIRFHAGKPLEASVSSGPRGVEAIRALLQLPLGTFVIDPNAKPPGKNTIERSFGELVLEDFFDS